jgi:hypothetical protein
MAFKIRAQMFTVALLAVLLSPAVSFAENSGATHRSRPEIALDSLIAESCAEIGSMAKKTPQAVADKPTTTALDDQNSTKTP